MPAYEDIDWNGLDFSKEQFTAVMSIDPEIWLKELELHEELFAKLSDRLPKELPAIRDLLIASLERLTTREASTETRPESLKAVGTAD